MRYYDLRKAEPLRGSNRYQRRYLVRVRRKQHGWWKVYLAAYGIFICCMFIARILLIHYVLPAHAQTVVSSAHKEKKVMKVLPTPTMTPTPTPDPRDTNPDYDSIKSAIYQTFGQYANSAMLVLSCENASLDPTKINTFGNSPVGSQDIGVFQINDYWNDIGNVELLQDPYVNIAVAWHKFKSSGYSFNQWTCGRKFGV